MPVLDRAWADAARSATSPAELLAVAAEVIAAAQSRSAGLVLAVFEGGRTDPELAALAPELTDQRAATVRWLVDALTAHRAARRRSGRRPVAADGSGDLRPARPPPRLDPERYGRWFARAAHALLYPGRTP